MDIFNLFDIALHAAGSLVSDPKSFETVIKKQEDVLDALEEDITITDEENIRIQKTYQIKKKQVHGDKNLVKLWHRAQKLRVYLSYYVNKIGDGKLDKLSVGSTSSFNEEPKEALLDILLSNNEDLKILKRAIPILKLGKVKTGGKRKKTRTNVPQRYVPKKLSKRDKKKQKKELKKSRKAYKKGKYYTRKKVKSFKSKVSPHILKARKMYKIEKIRPTRKLAKATKCKLKGLKKMFQKGQGAYFSSGSRPNQTGHSWGYARMASAITGGKASAVDFKIIKENCKKNSRAYKLAKKAYKKYKKGTKRVKQVQLGGRRMKETIVKFKKGPFPKKYTAIVKNKKTKKTRKIHFGDRRYQQYKDRTNLKLYKKKNHNTRKRMQNYFSRHSGTKKRGKAIKKEKRKSRGKYNAKILSHVYLW